MRPACSQTSTPPVAQRGRARIEKPCGGWRKATARLTFRFIRGGKRCAQSQQFRLSLTNSDSTSLTIVLRQSHNRAPKIPEFVPVSPSSTTRHRSAVETRKSDAWIGFFGAVRPMSASDTPCRSRSLSGLEIVGFPGLASRFMSGLALIWWTLSRSYSGPTSGADNTLLAGASSLIFFASAVAVRQ